MRFIFVMLGFLFTGLGAVGAFLPVLPTVPFLLLALFCFSKGSQRFHNWFISTALYRNHLADFTREQKMPLKTKVVILAFSTIMMGLAIVLMPCVIGKVVLSLLIVIKYYFFIFKIRTGEISREGIK